MLFATKVVSAASWAMKGPSTTTCAGAARIGVGVAVTQVGAATPPATGSTTCPVTSAVLTGMISCCPTRMAAAGSRAFAWRITSTVEENRFASVCSVSPARTTYVNWYGNSAA